MRIARLLPLVTLAAAACGILDAGDDRREDLADARARWSARGPAAYEYRYTNQCGECLPEWSRAYDVRVEDGVVVRAVDAQTGGAPPDGYEARTVDELFAVVEDAIGRAEVLHVEYDGQYGHPALISVDYARRIADDEFTIRVDGLRPAS